MTYRKLLESTLEHAMSYIESLDEVPVSATTRPVTQTADVDVNNASLKLIYQVLAYGKLLFARDELAESRYAIQKRKEYFDFKYYIEKYRWDLRSFYGVA